MSFDINWDLLKSGKEADQLKQHLNGRFTAIERPSFLGPIEIKSFNFGTVPPEITVENITDPLEDFYFDLFEDDHSPHQHLHSSIPTADSMEGVSGDSYNSSSLYNMEPHQYQKSSLDFQVEISCKYLGDCSMSIATELIINQPTPSFMSLPLILTLTKSSFQAKAIVAYIGNTINICLEEPEGGDILREFAVETEIGDNSKSVLKNVGKIEKFILAQLNRFLKDHVVFPNYHSIVLQSQIQQ